MEKEIVEKYLFLKLSKFNSIKIRIKDNKTTEKNFKIKFDLNEGKTLLVDKVAEMFILGCTIDYVEELGGSYIAVKNPNATSSCGCGESFGA